MTDSDNDTQYQARSLEGVGYWHNPDLQRARLVGLPTGALPTFERETNLEGGDFLI